MRISRGALLQLLDDLDPGDWEAVTAAAPWTVKDVVAHIIGDDLNRLSRSRDGHEGEPPRPGEDFQAFINRINEEWVIPARRLSPAVLRDLLAASTPEIIEFWEGRDIDRTGEPVTWAGPGPAPVWLDCARDFTEYWIHQQQIREAVHRPGDEGRAQLNAALDTFLRAVPFTLRTVGSLDQRLVVTVDGDGGGAWCWRHDGVAWRLWEDLSDPDVSVGFPSPRDLWSLCVAMTSPQDAARRVAAEGDDEVVSTLLGIVSIIR